MTNARPHKVIIIDQQRSNWERLRTCVSGSSYLPFCFDSVRPCLDNFASINPGAMVFGTLSFQRITRLIYHLKSINPLFPMLILGLTERIGDLIDSNRFENMLSLSDDSNDSSVKKGLLQLIKHKDHHISGLTAPLLVGENPQIQKLKKIITEAVRSKETVMITGEPGAGKDLVANVIHRRSTQNSTSFVKVNVLACSNNRVISTNFAEYFDNQVRHVQSTGQPNNENKNSVTVLLDGIEHSTPPLQKHFRFLLNNNKSNGLNRRSKSILRCRILSTSRLSIRELIQKRGLDTELFHQLSVFNINIPPLRQRSDDITLLCDFFCDKYSRLLSQPYCTISGDTKRKFASYSWPKNIRELEDTVRRMVIPGQEIAGNRLIDGSYNADYFDSNLLQNDHKRKLSENIERLFLNKDLQGFSLKAFRKGLVADTEKQIIKIVLERTKWNRRKAAKLLDISYKSLLNKIKDYEISR